MEISETILLWEKMSFDTFKNVTNKMCLEIIYLIFMNKMDLA